MSKRKDAIDAPGKTNRTLIVTQLAMAPGRRHLASYGTDSLGDLPLSIK